MRVVTAAQMAELDRRATEEYGIPISRLMDAAGRRVAQAAEEILGVQGGRRVLVLAGKGNNGGGGVVAARALPAGGLDDRAPFGFEPEEVQREAPRGVRAAAQARSTKHPPPHPPAGEY